MAVRRSFHYPPSFYSATFEKLVKKEVLFIYLRLKKEMILRVNTVAAEFRKVSNKQMADTTKRAISENVMINSQLAKMSDKTMELISDNDEIKATEKAQRQNIEILEDNEKELMKKNAMHKKVVN